MSDKDPSLNEEVVRWGAGCLVAAAALTGLLVLILLVAFALQPPAWVQVVLGVGLVIGGAVLAWLVASALGQSRKGTGGPRNTRSGDE